MTTAKTGKLKPTTVSSFADLAAALPYTTGTASAVAAATAEPPKKVPATIAKKAKKPANAPNKLNAILKPEAMKDVSTEELMAPQANGAPEPHFVPEMEAEQVDEAGLDPEIVDTIDGDDMEPEVIETKAAPVADVAVEEIEEEDTAAVDALKADLLKTMSVNPTAKAALLAELLDGSDVSSLLQAYAVTYEKIGAADAEDYAARYIEKITQSKFHKSVGKAIEMHTAQLVKLAQNVEKVLKVDVVINKLTADEFQAAAIAAIQDANVLRAAVLDLGRALELNTVAPEQSIAPLPTLIGILHHAGARVDVINSVSARYREATESANRTIDELQAALAAKDEELTSLRREMAEMVDARHVIPQGLSKYPILVTDGRKRFLCRTDGKSRSAPVKIRKLEWLSDATNALSFTSEASARLALDKLVWASVDKNKQPKADDVGSMKLRGVPLSDVRCAQHGVIVAMF